MTRTAGLALAVTALACGAARAELTLVTARYTCDRGVEVPVAYVNGDSGPAIGSSVAVLTVEGRQIALYLEVSASGARYGWPSDGSNYVWWTKGDAATLLWKDGTAGTETTILGGCRQQG